MKRSFLVGGLIASMMLAGCVVETPGGAVPPGAPEGACGAPGLQGLVGQNRRVLTTMKFGTEVRIIEPNSAVTMDFRAERLNIELDAAGTISSVTCG
ncbi:MAG: I78 family peptidase inhibitor [Paracoccaceae bacterium]